MARKTRPRVAGILQARMGSTRLPGKVLMRLAGKTILAHCIDRMRESGVLDEIVVATTALGRDDRVVSEAVRNGARCFRGSEDDVLGRYAGAATEVRADVVVRVTADNPLTCPEAMARSVREQLEGGWDYVGETGLPYGSACEVLTARTLFEADRLARTPAHREHVTLFIKETPHLFTIRLLDADPARTAPEIRVTVDTPEDLGFLRSMARRRVLSFRPFRTAEFIRRLREMLLTKSQLPADTEDRDGCAREVSAADGGCQ